jgi:hypothetical protein
MVPVTHQGGLKKSTVIVFKPDGKIEDDKDQQYGLSGIEQCIPRERVWDVPSDRDLALFGHLVPDDDPWTKSHMKVYAVKKRQAHQYPYGYPIHARCWDLLEMVMCGRDIVEKHLRCLVHVLRKRWTDELELVGNQFSWDVPEFAEDWEQARAEKRMAIPTCDPVKIPNSANYRGEYRPSTQRAFCPKDQSMPDDLSGFGRGKTWSSD